MIQGIVARFREKGATSPEKAMTAQELGLPPRFEEAMKRRLGATGIFVEVGGKYYLDEAKLKQVQEERRAGGWGGGGGVSWGGVIALRMARMVVGIAVVLLILSNVFIARSMYVSLAVLGLLILFLVLTVVQLYYLSRARSRWRASGISAGPP